MTDHHETGTGWPDRPDAEEHQAEPDTVVLEPAEPDTVVLEPAEPDTVVLEPAEPDARVPDTGAAVPAAARVPAGREWDVDPDTDVDPDADIDPDAGNAPDVDPGVEAPAPAAGTADGQPVPAAGRSRRQRVSTAGAAIGVLLVLFGFALVVQLRSNSGDEQLSTARPEDLVRIVSDLDARKDRLSEEINQLRATQQQLTAGSQGRAAALDAAAKRARDLGILAGTMAAQGPGIQVEFVPGPQGLKGGAAALILDAVQELRDAGAEAMEIDGGDGTAVRIIASSWFLDATDAALQVDGRTLTAPFRLLAIGDPQTMRTALNIPGGVVDHVRSATGNVIVNEPGTVRVNALHQAAAARYARPAG